MSSVTLFGNIRLNYTSIVILLKDFAHERCCITGLDIVAKTLKPNEILKEETKDVISIEPPF